MNKAYAEAQRAKGKMLFEGFVRTVALCEELEKRLPAEETLKAGNCLRG
jgi:hypothetical protein